MCENIRVPNPPPPPPPWGPMMTRLKWYLDTPSPHQLKKWTPSDITFWIRACLRLYYCWKVRFHGLLIISTSLYYMIGQFIVYMLTHFINIPSKLKQTRYVRLNLKFKNKGARSQRSRDDVKSQYKYHYTIFCRKLR